MIKEESRQAVLIIDYISNQQLHLLRKGLTYISKDKGKGDYWEDKARILSEWAERKTKNRFSEIRLHLIVKCISFLAI